MKRAVVGVMLFSVMWWGMGCSSWVPVETPPDDTSLGDRTLVVTTINEINYTVTGARVENDTLFAEAISGSDVNESSKWTLVLPVEEVAEIRETKQCLSCYLWATVVLGGLIALASLAGGETFGCCFD